MKCPACDNSLQSTTIEDVTVDVCKNGCGGIWFDRFELGKLDELHECAGEALLDLETDKNAKVDHERKRTCPKCEMPMMRHFLSPAMRVEIDECPQCAGVWLDAGELRSIRDLSMSEAERKEAARKYFSEIFDDRLEKMRAESEEQLERTRRIAAMFKYICPSYYMRRKQKRGAF